MDETKYPGSSHQLLSVVYWPNNIPQIETKAYLIGTVRQEMLMNIAHPFRMGI